MSALSQIKDLLYKLLFTQGLVLKGRQWAAPRNECLHPGGEPLLDPKLLGHLEFRDDGAEIKSLQFSHRQCFHLHHIPLSGESKDRRPLFRCRLVFSQM